MVSSIGAGLFTASNFAQSLQDIYNVSDRNGDGFLSLSEFDEAGNSTTYAKGLVDAYDRNGDGKLSQAELIAGTMAALGGQVEKPPEDAKEPLYMQRISEESLSFLQQFQSVDSDQSVSVRLSAPTE